MGTIIKSIGYYLPERLITNDDLIELVRRNCGPNVDLEGMNKKLLLNKAEKRYFKNPNETGIEMSLHAARNCLDKVNFSPKDLDLILYAGMLRDYVEPAMSVFLQNNLGAENGNALDISNACIGFLYGIHLASIYIESGIYRNILVVGAEDGSERIPWHLFDNGENRFRGFSALTVSDAAAAMLLQRTDSENGFKKFSFKTYGQYNDLCQIKIGKALNDLKIMVKSKDLAITAKEIMSRHFPPFAAAAEEVLGKIDLIFVHQITGEQKNFYGDLRPDLLEKRFDTFCEVGNTGSVSIPLGMALAEERGRLHRGDRVLLIVGASGFSFGGSALIY